MKKHVKKLYGNSDKPPDEANLHILVVITEWSYNKYVINILKDMHLPFQFLNHAVGSAKTELLYLLGLEASGKAMIYSLAKEDKIKEAIKRLNEDLSFQKPGKGIAFSIPLSGIGFSPVKQLNKELWLGWQDNMESEVEEMNEGFTHDLIVTIVDEGYSEEIMDAAKTAGATGGTMLDASRVGIEECPKFFGMSMQLQKDIVLILAKRENKVPIMEAISNYKLDTPKLLFSVPADNVEGLKNNDE